MPWKTKGMPEWHKKEKQQPTWKIKDRLDWHKLKVLRIIPKVLIKEDREEKEEVKEEMDFKVEIKVSKEDNSKKVKMMEAELKREERRNLTMIMKLIIMHFITKIRQLTKKKTQVKWNLKSINLKANLEKTQNPNLKGIDKKKWNNNDLYFYFLF